MWAVEESGAGAPLPAAWLAVWTDHEGPTCRLTLRGVLDVSTIAILERHLDVLGCCQCETIIVDITRLDHLDPTGAQVLHGLRHYMRGLGSSFELVGATPAAEATLALADRAD